MTRHLSFKSTFVRREEGKALSRIFAHDGGSGKAIFTSCHRANVSAKVQGTRRRAVRLSVVADAPSSSPRLPIVRPRFPDFLRTVRSGEVLPRASNLSTCHLNERTKRNGIGIKMKEKVPNY